MGRRAAAAKQYGQEPGQRTACHAGGYDPQRVAQGKGQRTLGHKGRAHHKVLRHGAALGLGEPRREQQAGQCQPQRGDHTARHDGGHEVILAVGHSQRAGDVGRLVDGPAVVGGHQRTQHGTQHQAAATLQLGKRQRHPAVEPPQRRVDDHKHQPADKKQAQQRHQQPGLDVVQILGDAAEQSVQQAYHQPGGKARNEAPPEPAGDPAEFGGRCHAGLGQVAAHQAGHQAGPVGNAVRDERGQNRVHHGERGVADVRHHRGPVRRAAQVLQKHRERQHHATRHHKGQHMGDAAHQVAVVLAAQLLPVVGAEGVAAAVDGCFAGDGLFQQGIRVAHGLPCRGVDQPLAHKPRQ